MLHYFNSEDNKICCRSLVQNLEKFGRTRKLRDYIMDLHILPKFLYRSIGFTLHGRPRRMQNG